MGKEYYKPPLSEVRWNDCLQEISYVNILGR